MKIILTAEPENTSLLNAWEKYHADLVGDCVELAVGDICTFVVDAVVAPTNSFGHMSGGIDAHYLNYFGMGLQKTANSLINYCRNGEILVGQVGLVPTSSKTIPYVILAPTMRVPMILGPETVNPYLAARAALREAKAMLVKSIAFPGLGTGVGRVPPEICARQMRAAIDEVVLGKKPSYSGWKEAQTAHQRLYTDKPRDLQNQP